MDTEIQKPLFRGHLHQQAFFIALGACAILVFKGSSSLMFFSSLIYSIGLLAMFGISAFYHRPYWPPKQRDLMKRIDHAAIFVLIATSMTAFCLLTLPEKGLQLITIGWIAATLGILRAFFWVHAPKYISASFYLIMGWLPLPYINDFRVVLGEQKFSLILIGGVIYTLGAVIYATKRPKLNPQFFGYHELFHLFTIIAATLHFIAFYQLIN
jgi:hemolysin III